MFGAAPKHVGKGSIMLMSWSTVLAGAAGAGVVKVTVMGPTIVQSVVSACGFRGHGPALVVVGIVGTRGRRWGWNGC